MSGESLGRVGAVEIICGDSLAVMAGMARGSVDVTATSPPYNIGVTYASGFDDAMPRADYLRWCRLWLTQLLRVTAPEGSLFLNVGGKPSDPYGPFEVLLEARAAGWTLQNTIYWVKSMTDGDGESIGHFKPLNTPRFLNDCAELVFHLTPGGDTPLERLAVGVPFVDQSSRARFGAAGRADKRCRGNVWVVPYDTIKSRKDERPHPATFPPRLAEMCFQVHGVQRIRMTLDPFAGLGSTARAAARLGLPHIAVELGREDALLALERVRAEAPFQLGRERAEPSLGDTLCPPCGFRVSCCRCDRCPRCARPVVDAAMRSPAEEKCACAHAVDRRSAAAAEF